MKFDIAADAGDQIYDVVIVGAGIAGSILAKALAECHWRVLVLEGGTSQSLTLDGYLDNLERYYAADAKVPNAPYKLNPNTPQPDVLAVRGNDPVANSLGYLIQKGPLPFRSDYVRQGGGTTLHWLGSCIRMLPQDFTLWDDPKRFARWPLRYEDLKPYYARAEREIGVAADSDDQRQLGEWLGEPGWIPDDYEFPMRRIPPSHIDGFFEEGLAGAETELDGATYPVRVTSTPQGRNSIPNPAYPGGYDPIGAIGNPDIGQRCQGNSSCVPICPVQAKYNATKSLAAAVATGRVRVVAHAAVSTVLTSANGRVTGLAYKAYDDPGEPAHRTFIARARHYVLAAHAIENAKLLLASNLGGPAVGWYLMDHPVMLTWGSAPQPLGTFRGPASTSGIETLRSGAFRTAHSAFRIEIDNWGWNWATGAPSSTIVDLVWNQGLSGRELRQRMFDLTQRQVRLGFLMEVPPIPENCIKIDRGALDPLGNPRPVVHFDLPDYTRRGMQAARQLSRIIFARLNIDDHTDFSPLGPGQLSFEGEDYVYQGAGHVIGGHVMGDDPRLSVVDADSRVWDHRNLWLVGCGNMASEGTSNPTLTLAALTLRAADAIDAELRQ
ncbi:MAG: GMC family oxidoreductase [Proteobacteria bacterium]|nr:GMC family oxidoreductase [Pseudomonadota bacterium]